MMVWGAVPLYSGSVQIPVTLKSYLSPVSCYSVEIFSLSQGCAASLISKSSLITHPPLDCILQGLQGLGQLPFFPFSLLTHQLPNSIATLKISMGSWLIRVLNLICCQSWQVPVSRTHSGRLFPSSFFFFLSLSVQSPQWLLHGSHINTLWFLGPANLMPQIWEWNPFHFSTQFKLLWSKFRTLLSTLF